MISDLKEEPVIPVVEAPVVAPVAPVAAPVAAPVIEPAPAVVPPAPAVVNKAEEIVFAPGEVKVDAGSADVTANVEDTFDPYGKTNVQDLKNTAPLVFGEDVAPKAEPVPSEEASSIPVPEFEIKEEKPEIKEEDKLDVDFPEVEKPVEPAAPAASAAPAEPAASVIEEVVPQAAPVIASSPDDIILPFGDPAFAIGAEEGVQAKADDIPQMPLYDSDNYNNPVNAVGSEQNISEPFNNASVYGDYTGAEAPSEVPPYQPYGAEAFSTADQSSYGTYGNQNVYMQGGVPMDNNGYPENGNADNGYVPGYDQAPVGGFGEYPQEGYQNPQEGYQNPEAGQYYQQEAAPQSGYTDYSAQPQQGFGDEYAQPQASASSSSSLDEEWFNNILGVDDSGQVYGGEQTFGYSAPVETQQPSPMPDPVQQAQYTNPGQTSYRPSGSGPNNNGKPQGSSPRPAASPAKSGNGGNGGGKKVKLNRNGYMFIAFLAILLICIIVVVSLIAKGYSKNKKPAETVPSTSSEEVTTPPTTTTTQATLPDASAPIGYFCFSEYTGYRTWWDVFHYVYGIDIDKNNDPRISIIITYNKLDPATYTGPNPGDRLLLPPLGVITGEIPNTWSAGGATTGGGDATSATTTTQAEVNSSIHLT